MTQAELRTLIPQSIIDAILTAQLAVAWAGEGGEEPRLNWWRTDFKSEFGGEDLFRRLLPHTWEWAVFQATREAAHRKDAELRQQDHGADEILSLFCLGFEIDERASERLQDLKRAGTAPLDALPGLRDVIVSEWNTQHFIERLDGHGKIEFTKVPAGRRLKGKRPESLELTVSQLLATRPTIEANHELPDRHLGRAPSECA